MHPTTVGKNQGNIYIALYEDLFDEYEPHDEVILQHVSMQHEH